MAGSDLPGSKPLIVSGGTKIASAALDDNETAIFNRDIQRLGKMFSLNWEISQLLLSDQQQYYQAAQMAKGSVGSNPTFAGINAKGTELGIQLIRAATVVNAGIASGGTVVYKWVQTYSIAGWTNIFGSSATPMSLASTGAGGNNVTNTNGRVLLAFGALLNTAPNPQIQEYRFHIGSVDYEVETIAWMPATDLNFAQLMGVFVVPVNGSFYMRGNINPSSTGGQDATELLGICYGTGDYLSTE